MKDKLFEIRHKICGNIAMFCRVKPYKGMLMRSEDFVDLDKNPIEPASRIKCFSCRQNVIPIDLEYNEEEVK